MANEKNMTAQRTSFWELICTTEVQIPNYQREYAQGRNNRRAELIREGFVESLYNSLEKNEQLELDFIFGGKDTGDDEHTFNPVDGQQRLTILFLLHWYIFVRAGRTEELKKMGESFRYRTRTTSETFCKEICDENWDLKFDLEEKENNQIALQIADRPWFTGAMNSDPTVRSMLVVVDCIHKKFAENIDLRYGELCNLLTSNMCPITFFCLDLNNVLGINSGIRDLYIKMNARGLALTDFELFKANLQKKDDSGERLDLMTEYFKRNREDNLTRVERIGKFNNEYTNFFFKLVDNGEIKSSNNDSPQSQMFDISMMNFINEVFRMRYFSEISKIGKSQKAYRSYNEVFRKMSGRELISFIEKSGEYYNKKIWGKEQPSAEEIERIKGAIIGAFENIIKLMDKFSSRDEEFDNEQGNENTSTNCQKLINEMLRKYAVDPQMKKPEGLELKESLARMGMFKFILKFGIPKNDSVDEAKAFDAWYRFIQKINNNSDFNGFDEVVETLVGYEEIIDAVPTEDCTLKGIIKAIKDAPNLKPNLEIVGSSARMQLQEEIVKATLMLSGENGWDDKWFDAIKRAEDYYNDNGQIWFLLDLSEIDGKYDRERFLKGFEVSKKLFDQAKHIRKVKSKCFERALLAVPEFDKDDHLDSMSQSTVQTKKFVGEDFSRHVSHSYCGSSNDRERTKYMITMALLQKMVNNPEILDVNMREWLQKYFSRGKSSVDWKNVFIQNELIDKKIDGLPFKNTFEPDAWVENSYSYTAVYTNPIRRTDSGELHSFLMASRLSDDKRAHVSYHTSSEEEYITDGFPNRYFEVYGSDDNAKFEIGYMQDEFYSRIDGEINKIGNEKDVDEFVSEHVN